VGLTAVRKVRKVMLDVSKIQCIVKLSKDGKNNAEIARTVGVSEPTVRKYIAQKDFSPTPPTKRGRKSQMDQYRNIIIGWLEEDKKNWRKQRHSAVRIYERLRDEHGCTLSESTVRHYVKDLKAIIYANNGNQFLDLVWHPGEMQVDFGDADIVFRGIKTRAYEFVSSFPYSNIGLTQIFLGQSAECVCEGLKQVFTYIDGVPPRIVFDNATGVGRKIHNCITTSKLFGAFALHYGFEYSFCNPYSGHEKGNVENKVGTLRRNLLVPPPRLENIEHFNKTLLDKSYSRSIDKVHYKKGESEAALFEEDKMVLLPLPDIPFEVVRYETHKCDKYGKVCLNGCHYYSVSPKLALTNIIVGLKATKVEFFTEEGEFVCEHVREYGNTPSDSTEPANQLNALCMKPGGWRNSQVRVSFSEDLRKYVDSMNKSEIRDTVKILRDQTSEVGYKCALQAIEEAYTLTGKVEQSCVEICATRIKEGYALVEYDEEIDLSEYDVVFEGKE
jgi:transposase